MQCGGNMMKCNACSRFLLCDKKECNFKRIRGVEIRRSENDNTNDIKEERKTIHTGEDI